MSLILVTHQSGFAEINLGPEISTQFQNPTIYGSLPQAMYPLVYGSTWMGIGVFVPVLRS